MRVLNALLMVALLDISTVVPGYAQRSGVVGTVSDTLGMPLQGVFVELTGTDFGSITNQTGDFKLTKVTPGTYTISMRRVGFEALQMKLEVKSGDPMELDFELTPTQVRLATIVVKEDYSSNKLKRVGFESRLKTSGVAPSHFITRADILKTNPQSLTHMLERQGGRVRNCIDALVYIDGVPPTLTPEPNTVSPANPFSRNSSLRSAARNASPNNMEYRALEFMPVNHVEGMEIYTSVSEIPAEFRPGGNANVNGKCVILLWTREK